MASYNKVILMGNLTRDPELKYLQSGMAVANLGLAVNRVYTDRQSGEKKEEVCFVDAEAWGKTAETMNEYLQKGRPVFVEGRLRQQRWETALKFRREPQTQSRDALLAELERII